MPDEEQRDGNSRVPIRIHFEQILESCQDNEKQWRLDHMEAHRLERQAIESAQRVNDERLAKLNELRAEVVTDRSEYVRRDTLDLLLKPINELLATLTKAQANFDGRWLATFAIMALGAVALGVLIYLHG